MDRFHLLKAYLVYTSYWIRRNWVISGFYFIQPLFVWFLPFEKSKRLASLGYALLAPLALPALDYFSLVRDGKRSKMLINMAIFMFVLAWVVSAVQVNIDARSVLFPCVPIVANIKGEKDMIIVAVENTVAKSVGERIFHIVYLNIVGIFTVKCVL